MAYAVVKFLCDDSYSEVPTIWLTEDQKFCYWPPRSKNTLNLMKNGTQPAETWDRYDVSVEGYCDSLKKARRKAENTESSNEEPIILGKGKRKKTKSVKVADPSSGSHSDESDDSVDRCTPPPRMPCNQPKHVATSISSAKINDKSSSLSTYTSTVNINNIEMMSSPRSSHQIDITNSAIEGTSGTNSVSTSNKTNENDVEISNDKIDKTKSEGVSYNDIINAEVVFVDEAQSPLDRSSASTPMSVLSLRPHVLSAPSTSKEVSKGVLDEILNLCANTNLYVKAIDERLKIIENSGQGSRMDKYKDRIKDICLQLPLRTIENLELFEQLLKIDDTFKSAFTAYINGIGGHYLKDNIHRILKKIFATELAKLCSWLGQRNNRKVCDSIIIGLMKDVVMPCFRLAKDHEFENIIKEWFRLSSQRFKRENEKERKGTEENEKEN